ncbi:hypothetical protein [Vibrio parahaemolyticus]|uniref:hypothetical protein n=2 Tax=Vibrio parahaemolyticus TaxID=670 RepID=UPI001121598A|nr:hypothetical protein [Vibrio parahaemolyticus]TNZ99151.1 hypothetical protein CGK36_22320 [Vibrio parahaemolyticus]TOA58173.1 hypothetical protein CGK24_17040 [Vibrio parahaemolyticus]
MLAGDVLLVGGEGKISKSLLAAQKVIYSKVTSSHVEFSLGDGVFIHSTNDKGVHLTLLLDEDIACNGNWRVIRHKSVSEIGEVTDNLQKSAMYYFAQDYNKVFMGSGNEHSSFCSELVAKAYERANICIMEGKAPSKVTPAHFDKLADELVDWVDVTQEYKSILSDMKENEFVYRMAAQMLSFTMERRKRHEPIRNAMIQKLESGSESSQETAIKIKEMLAQRELSFWHEKNS